jgi:signal peptidase I
LRTGIRNDCAFVRENRHQLFDLLQQPKVVMTSCTSVLGDVNALKCQLAGEVLRSSGTLRLQVTGWSMLPAVMPGDTLVIERTHHDTVAPGDIVLFGRDRRFFVHRVVATSQPQSDAVLTRGDALPAADPPVPANDLLGRVSLILRNGRHIQPRRRPRFSERAIAAWVRRSDFAARIVVGVYGVRASFQRPSQTQASRIQTSQVQTS